MDPMTLVSQRSTTKMPTKYVRIYRMKVDCLVPSVHNPKQTHYSHNANYNMFALPLLRPIYIVRLSLQSEKAKLEDAANKKLNGSYLMEHSADLGEALEVEHKTAEEWVALLCPQYKGFPVYEVQ